MDGTLDAGRERPALPDPAGVPRPWLEHYPPGVPPTYAYPAVPLTRLLDDAARDFPGVDATVYGRARMTYAEVLDGVDRFATALAGLGVGRGTRVGIVLPNLPAVPVAVFAVLRLGGVVVQVAPGTPGAEIGRRLRVTGCEVVVVAATSLPDVNAVRARLPRLRHVVATGVEDWLAFPRDRLFRVTGRRDGTYRPVTRDDDALRMTALLAAAEPLARQTPVEPTTLAAVQFPARTAGGGALLTHANLLAGAFQARLWIPDIQAGRERVLLAQPISSAHGFAAGLLASVLAATTVLLPRRVEADGLTVAAARARATLVHVGTELVVDTAARSVRRGADADALRAGLVGDGPVAADALTTLEERTGARLRATHGRADAPLIHACPVYGRVKRGHIGLPVTDTVATVVATDDPARSLPPGTEGVLAVHGPQVATGVLAHDGPVPDDGWLLTGERAVMDEDGSFRLAEGGGS